MNIARQETGAARIGNTVYVVGGLLAGFPFTATPTVEAYDIATNTWSEVQAMPVGLDHAAVAALDGLLYVIGGFEGNFVAQPDVRVYDPATDQWNDGPPLPAARGAAWAVALEDRIYVFGGVSAQGVTQDTTLIFDPQTGWSTGTAMPTPREHLTATTDGEFIYVIGGRSGAATAACERYDPANDDWESLEPMPTARSATLTAHLGGRIYVAGGEIPQLFAVHEVYDIANNTWSSDLAMPVPRHGIAAALLDDCILAPAGGTVQGLAPTTHVDCFRPSGPSVPALSAGGIAMLAVLLTAIGGVLLSRKHAGATGLRPPHSSR